MRLGSVKKEPRSRAAGYQSVARSLMETARGLDTIAEARYGKVSGSYRCTRPSPTPTR